MKMGTIGTGMITEWLNTAFQDNGLECTAVYSRREETGRRLADKYNMPKVYTDLDAMLHDEELDCIYIASQSALFTGDESAGSREKRNFRKAVCFDDRGMPDVD